MIGINLNKTTTTLFVCTCVASIYISSNLVQVFLKSAIKMGSKMLLLIAESQ